MAGELPPTRSKIVSPCSLMQAEADKSNVARVGRNLSLARAPPVSANNENCMSGTHFQRADRVVPLAAGTSGLSQAAARARLDSIDLLRGLVMVLMALDHTRDFFAAGGPNPRDIADPALFLTRWVTHFCAPTFIFLAGVSAYLYGGRGRSAGEVSWFLLTRGVWLVVVEFTVIRFCWTFSLYTHFFVMQVIWVIGASMIVLAGLVHLPRWVIAAIGVAMIVGHNLVDGVGAEQFGNVSWLWKLLHQPGLIEIGPQTKLFVLYTLVPWSGVMAAGYALGPVFRLDLASRRSFLLRTGIAVAAGFVVLRATNLYGDPAAWTMQSSFLGTLLSFIDCEKYPPSLLFLMMTLGPALILLALFECADGAVASRITTFGRVPFFFYVVHIAFIHALAVGFASITLGDIGWTFGSFLSQKPMTYGLNLFGVYAVWLCVVVVLYPLCRWFASLKRQRHEWWWSYL
jgi:uncharacterized membrane protein